MGWTTKGTLLLVVAMAGILPLIGVADVMAAEMIGINFVGGQGGGGPVGPGEVAGAAPQQNWNNLELEIGGAAGMVDDTGAATTLAVEWSSANTWGGTAPGTTGDDHMMNGWLDDGGDGLTVTVTGVPYAAYNVYVYGTSDAGNAGRHMGFDLQAGGGSKVLDAGPWEDPVNADGSYYVGQVAGNDGVTPNPSYLLFTNVTDSAFTIQGIRDLDVGRRSPVSGFQVVAVPEPASAVLSGLGLILLLFWGWRQRK